MLVKITAPASQQICMCHLHPTSLTKYRDTMDFNIEDIYKEGPPAVASLSPQTGLLSPLPATALSTPPPAVMLSTPPQAVMLSNPSQAVTLSCPLPPSTLSNTAQDTELLIPLSSSCWPQAIAWPPILPPDIVSPTPSQPLPSPASKGLVGW